MRYRAGAKRLIDQPLQISAMSDQPVERVGSAVDDAVVTVSFAGNDHGASLGVERQRVDKGFPICADRVTAGDKADTE